MNAAVGARIAISKKLDAGGARRRCGEEGAAGALASHHNLVIVLGTGGQAGNIISVEMVGRIAWVDRDITQAVTGAGAPFHLESGIGCPLPEDSHLGVDTREDQGGAFLQNDCAAGATRYRWLSPWGWQSQSLQEWLWQSLPGSQLAVLWWYLAGVGMRCRGTSLTRLL